MGYIIPSNQVATFLWSLLLGVAMCMVYDILRALHKVSVKGFFEVLLSDLLFWCLWALITFSFLVLRCKGEVRGYVLFGQAVGFVAARLTVSRVVFPFFTACLRFFSRIFTAFGKKLHGLLRIVEKNIKKSLKYLKKCLQHILKLLYNQLKIRPKKVNLQENESGNT